jgi:hypothetical protein
MPSRWNDYTYTKEFVGSLHAESEPVPIEVNTRLRIMSDETAREIRKHKNRHCDAPPRYEFSGGENLPLHPCLLAASGRHYFEW